MKTFKPMQLDKRFYNESNCVYGIRLSFCMHCETINSSQNYKLNDLQGK
ncbi:MAG: hypothetical protein IKI95_07095 [Clostridia bacterium]|nr:hypothetical protein [Clostridia bacterium]